MCQMTTGLSQLRQFLNPHRRQIHNAWAWIETPLPAMMTRKNEKSNFSCSDPRQFHRVDSTEFYRAEFHHQQIIDHIVWFLQWYRRDWKMVHFFICHINKIGKIKFDIWKMTSYRIFFQKYDDEYWLLLEELLSSQWSLGTHLNIDQKHLSDASSQTYEERSPLAQHLSNAQYQRFTAVVTWKVFFLTKNIMKFNYKNSIITRQIGHRDLKSFRFW